MIKKLNFLCIIFTFISILAFLDLFAMEECVLKEIKKWPKIECCCKGNSKSITAVARIEPGLFVKSVAVQVDKDVESGKFKCIIYERSASGVLRSKIDLDLEKLKDRNGLDNPELDYPGLDYRKIVGMLKEKIAEFENKALIEKV